MLGSVNRVDGVGREWNVGNPVIGNAEGKTEYSVIETKRAEDSTFSLSKSEDKEFSAEKLQEEVDKLNEQLKLQNKNLRFKYSEDAGKYYVQVINPATQEVLESIPPEYILDLSKKMKDIIGLFIDKKL